MVEVGQKLGSGVYRLSALRSSQSRPVRTAESPGPLLVNCTFSGRRIKEDSTQKQREVRPVSESRATQRQSDKLNRVRRSGRQQETLRCATSLELDSSRFIRFVQTRENLQAHTTALQQHLIQEKLLPGRMTPWTRDAVFIHPDTFMTHRQRRALCTFIFLLAEKGQKRLKLNPGTLQASTASRSYSSSKDGALLYRSRSAYYDILKVSPGATQAQIKTAYYKQSFIYHPDKNQGNKEAPQRFAEISEAYTVLGNIHLRRKYDHGILSQSDIQSTGRPSPKETTSRSTGSPQHQYQQRARQSSQAGGRTMFDFDAFYQAHYGERLQRERYIRAMKQRMQEQKKNFGKQTQEKIELNVTAMLLLVMAGLIIASFSNP